MECVNEDAQKKEDALCVSTDDTIKSIIDTKLLGIRYGYFISEWQFYKNLYLRNNELKLFFRRGLLDSFLGAW